MLRYRFIPQLDEVTYLSLAHTNIKALFPSGNAPIALVLRLISRFTRSVVLLVRILRQCWDGKSI